MTDVRGSARSRSDPSLFVVDYMIEANRDNSEYKHKASRTSPLHLRMREEGEVIDIR